MDTEKFTFEFENIGYDVVNNTRNPEEKYHRLLNGISGRFESGSITGIMGPSGSCKTSFLNFISGRIESDAKTCGIVKFRNRERNQRNWLKECCYLEQDDCIISEQTAYEYILFAAKCKLLGLSDSEIEKKIKDVMKRLDILDIADVCLSSVSGGERKRVVIAAEFIIGADVLILDEPTSGLDSHLALKLMYNLKSYAQENNKIVIITIHQPGPGLFDMIDNLFFFYKGCVIYSGPISELNTFLESQGLLVTTRLSTPELLFELFTNDSHFDEVRDCREKVEKLVNEKMRELDGKIINENMSYGLSYSSFIDWSINLKHISLIFKRTALLSLGVKAIFFSTIRALAFGLILFWFFTLGTYITAASVIPSLRNYRYDDDGFFRITAKILNKLNEKFPEYNSIFSTTIMMYMTKLYSSFTNINMFSDELKKKAHILKETYKGVYSITTYYTSIFLFEFITGVTYMTFALFMFFSVGFSFENIFKNYNLLIYAYVMVFFSKIFCIFFEAVMVEGKSSIINLINVIKSFLYLMLDIPFVIMLCNGVKSMGLGYLVYLKYFFVIFGIDFFSEYFYLVIYDKLLASNELKGSFDNIPMIFLAIGKKRYFVYDDDKSIRSWFMGNNIPKWGYIVLAFAINIALILLSIIIYNLRFTPKLRLKHSE